MKFFTLLLMAVSLFAVSCERHDFEGPYGSKQLHQKHVAHTPSHLAEDAEKQEENPAH